MKWTLNLPDELAARLEGREPRLLKALELGLERLENEEDDADLPKVWQSALTELMDRRCRVSEGPPSTEELIAYHRDEMEPDVQEKFLERLTLHPEAVRDLTDLIELDRDRLQSPAEQQRTTEALRTFHSRLGAPVRTSSFVERSSSLRYRPLLALAAVLLALAGASWLGWTLGLRETATGPRYATVIDVGASRGARPFQISRSAREILLILPFDAAAPAEGGAIRITAAGGDLIYEGTFHRGGDTRSRLYLSLPSDSFRAGVYHLEIAMPGATGRPEIRKYRFAIDGPGAP